ncbi:DISARM system phospholipase D-like protein DrmC [Billgrantia montanilacus]|nr:DISARM system phospholipase D-like protein DrmC [Halomonas montanilacus]
MHRCVVEFATTVSKGALRSVVDALIELGEINEIVLQHRVTHYHSKELLRRLLREAAVHHISAPRLAGMLEGASCVVEYYQELSPELVWTGPVPAGTATRQTEQVMLEVIRGARKRLFLTSFVAYKVDRIVIALNEAADRGVDVKILLESSEDKGGNLSMDSVSLMRGVLPRARFYAWQIRPEEFTGGSVHAKVAVADDRLAFITSANLTGYAMERNMEAGVLLRGGEHPRKLADYLESMVSTGVVEEL